MSGKRNRFSVVISSLAYWALISSMLSVFPQTVCRPQDCAAEIKKTDIKVDEVRIIRTEFPFGNFIDVYRRVLCLVQKYKTYNFRFYLISEINILIL